MNIKPEKLNDGFYHLRADLEKYPEAIIYIIWSFRGPGKTTSALWYMAENDKKFVYMKRTNDDVDFICGKTKMGELSYDVSPFKTVNRIAGSNIRAHHIDKGFGGFYDTNEKGECYGNPIGYILSLNKVRSIKGADLSECEFVILDEFIPQVHEVVRHKEGEALLEFVRTVGRDRVGRGLPPVKLILFANAEDISCPITQTLEVIDNMAELSNSGKKYLYMNNRKILLHHIEKDEAPNMTDSYDADPLLRAMSGTAWAKKSYEGQFTNNDFSAVEKCNMKNMQLYAKISYKKKDYYIYINENSSLYYMTFSRSDQVPEVCYDLNKENDQKAFWIEECQSLRCDCIEGRMKFEKYSMYDLIINYKKYFKI